MPVKTLLSCVITSVFSITTCAIMLFILKQKQYISNSGFHKNTISALYKIYKRSVYFVKTPFSHYLPGHHPPQHYMPTGRPFTVCCINPIDDFREASARQTGQTSNTDRGYRYLHDF